MNAICDTTAKSENLSVKGCKVKITYAPADTDCLDAIQKLTGDMPLVLHGGSDNPDEEIRQACQIGIRKVNIASDYKAAYSRKLNEIMNETGEFKFSTLMPKGFEAARAVIRHKMELFGSVGKASVYWEKHL